MSVSTHGTILRSVGGVDFNQLPISTFSLIGKIVKELSPGCIRDRLGKTMIIRHLVNRQIFNGDDAELVYYFSTELVGKVRASIGYPFMDMRDNLFRFLSFWCSFLQLRELPLSFSQRLFILSKAPGYELRSKGFVLS